MKSFILNMTYNPLNFFTGLVHRGSWRRLQSESCGLRERALATGTWANKVSHLRSYIVFTSYFAVPDFPVFLGVLLRFIAFLGRGPYAARSATNIIGSLKWFSHFLHPPSVEVFNTVLVSSTIQGLKAQLSRPVRQKLPFSVNHLSSFYDLLDLSDPKQLAGWCAMLLAFFGCFRLSNLVPTSKKKFDPCKHLKRNDISFEKNFVLVFYKWSKTNQNLKKVSWIPICAVSDERFNVKHFLTKLFETVKVPNDSPLFSFNVNQFHSKYSLIRLLDQCVFRSGLSQVDFSWHSFRRGSAVFAFELGLADSAVQLLGDWSSPAFKQYLEFAFVRKAAIAEKIAKSFNSHVNKL